MEKHVLAGDIGGTKTLLALFRARGEHDLELLREGSFPSKSYSGLEAVVGEFLKGGERVRVHASAFGIAGPVLDGRVTTTNLPWEVDAASIVRATGSDRVRLMNDLETTAYGALFLPRSDLARLNAGRERPGHIAVIAAGTGLGQSYLFWDGKRHIAAATEGGHTDFAPRTPLEFELLEYLQKRIGRVSYERILSGPGLHAIFTFLAEVKGRPVDPAVRERAKMEDPSAVVGTAGLERSCPASTEALELFVSLYGAQAGNFALTVMALGGVYVGGGIVTKILPVMQTGRFMQAFTAKGRYAELMSSLPVHIILNPKASLLGAAHAAAELAYAA